MKLFGFGTNTNTFTYGTGGVILDEDDVCVYCGDRIPQGEEAGTVAYYIGGSWYSKYACVSCLKERDRRN